MRRARAFRIAVLSALLVVVGACGGDDGGGGGGATQGPDGTTGGSEPLPLVFQPSSDGFSALPELYLFSEGVTIFEEEGLDAERLAVLPSSAEVASVITRGDADVTFLGSSGVLSIGSAGRDLVSLRVTCQPPITVVSLRNDVIEELGVAVDAPIEDRIDALRGLNLAVNPPGGYTDVILRSTLLEYGLDPDSDLGLSPFSETSAMVASAREGQSDGIAFSPPVSTVGVGEGWASVWINFAADVPFMEGIPYIDIGATRARLEENPEVIRRFMSALWRAQLDIRDNPEVVAEAVKQTWFADLDQEVFDAAFATARPCFVEGITNNEDGYNKMVDFVNSTADTPFDYPFDSFYEMGPAEETRPEGW